MAKSDGKLIFDTNIDRTGFEKGVASLKSVGSASMKAVAGALTVASTALVAFGGFSVKASIEFESAFAGVKKVLEATDAEFAVLEKGIRELSKSMPQSASAIAGVAESAGQLGIAKEDILDFTKTMIMMGDATDLTAEDASTSFARIGAVTGLLADDYSKLGSVTVALGNQFATTESEVVGIGLRLAGTASQVGITEAQMFGLAGAMSSVGLSAEAGGSAMSRILAKMNTEVLSSGEKLDGFAKVAGSSAEDFGAKWKASPTEALVDFTEGLGKIKDSGGDVTATLKELGISSQAELDTMLRLSGASDGLVSALSIADEAWESNTALVDEASQRYETTESKIAMLKNQATDLAITFGQELSPQIGGVIDVLGGYMSKISEAVTETGTFGGAVGVIGEIVADMVMRIAEQAPQMVTVATQLVSSFVNSIAENSYQIVNGGIGVVTSLVESITTLLPEILNLGMILIIELVSGLGQALPGLMTMGIDMIIGLADMIIQQVPFIIDAGMDLLFGLVKGIMDNLPKLIENVPRIINSFTGAIVAKLPDILLMGMKLLWEVGKGLIKAIPTLIANIPAIILAIVNAFMLMNWASMGSNMLKNIGQGIKSFGPNVVSWVKTIAQNILNAIGKIFTGNASGMGKNLVQGIWNGISNVVPWIMSKISGFGSTIVKGIKGVFGIKSPSTIMRDQIGKNLVLGMGVGVEKEVPKLQRDIDKELSDLTAGMKSTVEMEAVGDARILSGNNINKAVYEKQESLHEDKEDEQVIIKDNVFEVRHESDIEKIARQIMTLTKRKQRGGV